VATKRWIFSNDDELVERFGAHTGLGKPPGRDERGREGEANREASTRSINRKVRIVNLFMKKVTKCNFKCDCVIA
jgi:hypothetical protein